MKPALWLGLLACCYGCQAGAPSPSSATPSEHVHHAPHGGVLAEVGEEVAHLEVVWDESSGRLTLYVLDGECEQPVRIKQPELVVKGEGWETRLSGQSNSLSDEKVGDTSQFAGQVPALRGKKQWQAEVSLLEVFGRKFRRLPLRYPD